MRTTSSSRMLGWKEVAAMTAVPVNGPSGPQRQHAHLARRAVALAALGAIAFAAAVAGIAIPYAVGGEDAVEDVALGVALTMIMTAGVLASLAGFVIAIVAAVRRWALLWLPLLVFPAIVLFLVLGEAFWWE